MPREHSRNRALARFLSKAAKEDKKGQEDFIARMSRPGAKRTKTERGRRRSTKAERDGRRSQEDIAAAIGISPPTWRKIRNGAIVPPEFRLRKICEVLGLDYEKDVEKLARDGDPGAAKQIFEWHRKSENGPYQKRIAREYYSKLDYVLETYPVITKKEWIPKKLIQLKDVDAQLKLDSAWKGQHKDADITDDHRNFLEGHTYSNFIALVAPKIEQTNNDCYRLLAINPDMNELPGFVFGKTDYQTYINNCLLLNYELAEWCFDYELSKLTPHPNGRHFNLRGPASDIFTFMNRSCAVSLTALLILKTEKGNYFYLQDRLLPANREKQLLESPYGLHCIPSGTFQPDAAHFANNPRDFSFERTLMREYAEEMLGVMEVRDNISAQKDFYDLEKLKPFVKGLETGAVRTYYLGFGISPASCKPDVFTAMVIEASAFPPGTFDFVESWESRKISDFPLDEGNHLQDWIESEKLIPAGKTCLMLAEPHIASGKLLK